MEKVKKEERLKGKAWLKAYENGNRLTKIAMLSHALWVHKIASINYGYLSYLHSFKYLRYKDLLDKVTAIEKTYSVSSNSYSYPNGM